MPLASHGASTTMISLVSRGQICRVNMIDDHVYFFYWDLSAIIVSKERCTFGWTYARTTNYIPGSEICILTPDFKVDTHLSVRKQVYFIRD